MNSTSYIALFILVAVGLVAGVFSWISWYKKKERDKKLLQEFDDFVIKNNLTIDKKQTLNKNMIGLDRLNMKLVFMENTSVPQKIHLVNLTDLSDCHLVKEKDRSNEHIGKIFLRCIAREKNQPEIILPVYDEFNDNIYKMMRLSKKAAYWKKTINIFREVAIRKLKTENS